MSDEENKSPSIRVSFNEEPGSSPSQDKNINELMATIIKNVVQSQNTKHVLNENGLNKDGQNKDVNEGGQNEDEEDPEYARIIEETFNTPPPIPHCCPNRPRTRTMPFMRTLIEEADGDIDSDSSESVDTQKWKAILLLLKSHKNLTQALIKLIEDK